MSELLLAVIEQQTAELREAKALINEVLVERAKMLQTSPSYGVWRKMEIFLERPDYANYGQER